MSATIIVSSLNAWKIKGEFSLISISKTELWFPYHWPEIERKDYQRSNQKRLCNYTKDVTWMAYILFCLTHQDKCWHLSLLTHSKVKIPRLLGHSFSLGPSFLVRHPILQSGQITDPSCFVFLGTTSVEAGSLIWILINLNFWILIIWTFSRLYYLT